jgi:hypothetical protein
VFVTTSKHDLLDDFNESSHAAECLHFCLSYTASLFRVQRNESSDFVPRANFLHIVGTNNSLQLYKADGTTRIIRLSPYKHRLIIWEPNRSLYTIKSEVCVLEMNDQFQRACHENIELPYLLPKTNPNDEDFSVLIDQTLS